MSRCRVPAMLRGLCSHYAIHLQEDALAARDGPVQPNPSPIPQFSHRLAVGVVKGSLLSPGKLTPVPSDGLAFATPACCKRAMPWSGCRMTGMACHSVQTSEFFLE